MGKGKSDFRKIIEYIDPNWKGKGFKRILAKTYLGVLDDFKSLNREISDYEKIPGFVATGDRAIILNDKEVKKSRKDMSKKVDLSGWSYNGFRKNFVAGLPENIEIPFGTEDKERAMAGAILDAMTYPDVIKIDGKKMRPVGTLLSSMEFDAYNKFPKGFSTAVNELESEKGETVIEVRAKEFWDKCSKISEVFETAVKRAKAGQDIEIKVSSEEGGVYAARYDGENFVAEPAEYMSVIVKHEDVKNVDKDKGRNNLLYNYIRLVGASVSMGNYKDMAGRHGESRESSPRAIAGGLIASLAYMSYATTTSGQTVTILDGSNEGYIAIAAMISGYLLGNFSKRISHKVKTKVRKWKHGRNPLEKTLIDYQNLTASVDI